MIASVAGSPRVSISVAVQLVVWNCVSVEVNRRLNVTVFGVGLNRVLMGADFHSVAAVVAETPNCTSVTSPAAMVSGTGSSV